MFEEAALVYVVYGAVLAALGGSPTGCRSGGRTVPDEPAMGLALLGVLATVLASLPYIHRRLRRPAGGSGDVRLRRPAALWNVLVASATG